MIRFGSRGSDLALTQTRFVAETIQKLTGSEHSIEIYTTRGDKNLKDPLPAIGGKGLFTAELEAALLDGRIDAAVHSLKDLPVEDPAGLTIGAIPAREKVHDVLVFRPTAEDPEGGTIPLVGNGVVGTSSPRRRGSLLALRSDLEVRDIRGNVETRARKVADGDYDATLLAAAGLSRLKLETPGLTRVDLPVHLFTPAPGQGALAVQCRADDEETIELLSAFHDPTTAACVHAERQLLALLGGGCSMPLGALVQPEGSEYCLLASLFSDTMPGSGIAIELRGDEPMALAEAAAERLRPFLGNPLAGERIVLLRPGGEGGQLARALGLAGAEVETIAVSEIVPSYVADEDLAPLDTIAFTSTRAVDRFFEEAAGRGFDLSDTQFFAVGPATQAAVRERGHVCTCPAGGSGGHDLGVFLNAQLPAGSTVLFPCAQERHGGLEAAAGALDLRPVPIYRTLTIAGIELPHADRYIFTSPSAVRAIVESEAVPAAGSRIAFGETTATAMRNEDITPDGVAANPTAETLVRMIQELR